MQNAKKFNDRITIGIVPTEEDLQQLKQIGVKTLVDLREEREKFSGQVGERAQQLGLRYVAIPVSRDDIKLEDVLKFYQVAFEQRNEPIYAFSRFGKKPLTFLLLFEAGIRGEPVQRIFRKASNFGLSLDGDLSIQEFVVRFINSNEMDKMLETMRTHIPSLEDKMKAPREAPRPATLDRAGTDRIQVALANATAAWALNHDSLALRTSLLGVVRLLDDL